MSRYINADELIFIGLDNPDDDHLFEFVPREFIDNAPTADVVEVVHGEWISWYVEVKHGNCEEYIPHTACCACGTEIDPYHKDVYKWCPFCGARMDGEI